MKSLLALTGILEKTRAALSPERYPVTDLSTCCSVQHQDIEFQTSDGLTLKGWWIKGSSDVTIILAHSFGACRSGWAGDDAAGRFHKIDWLPTICALAAKGYNIVAFDHRACGQSDGDMTYFGKAEAIDIVAAVDSAIAQSRQLRKFAIIGFSSGANAALRAINVLEERRNLELAAIAVNIYWYERMIRESTRFFTTIPLIMLPLVKRATKVVVGFDPMKEINPAKILPTISAPVMLVNAIDDEIADIADIKEIYQSRSDGTELVVLKNETRFDAYHYVEKHLRETIDFLERAFADSV